MTSIFIRIGKNIDLRLKELQVSKQDSMDLLNVNNRDLDMLLAGKKALNVRDLEKIADRLSFSVEELIRPGEFEKDEESTLSQLLAHTNNPDTREKLHFINHLMDLIIQMDRITLQK